MKVLAIETSCDDTSLAVVSYEGGVFECENMVSFTQIDIHAAFGGVVPELASREHLHKIILVFQDIIRKVGFEDIDSFFLDIDRIVVTTHPGLPGSLIIGKTFALCLSVRYDIPLSYANHLHGHIFSFLLGRSKDIIKKKNLVLSVSGGHSDLSIFSGQDLSILNNCILSIDKIGSTRDDAIGEVFDKVSRLLGGPYPGGLRIAQQAHEYISNEYGRLFDQEFHNEYSFKRILLEPGSFDFSFSGMKSQAHNFIERYKKDYPDLCRHSLPKEFIAYLSYKFQDAATDILVKKIFAYVHDHEVDLIALVGGVSANTSLRDKITQAKEIFEKQNSRILEFYTPIKFDYCTDNAAMIGVAGIIGFL